MNLHGKDIKIFAGNSNRQLQREIALRLDCPWGSDSIKVFRRGDSDKR